MSQHKEQKRPRGEQEGVSSSRTEGATRIYPEKVYDRLTGGQKASGLGEEYIPLFEKESRFRRDKSRNYS